MDRTGLLDLPEDVLVQHILGRLDFRGVLRCSMVRSDELCAPSLGVTTEHRFKACKTLYKMKEASSALQLKIELGADGIADTTISLDDSVSSAERLERHHAWRSLEWKKLDTITLSRPCDMSDFIGGVFAQIENDKDKLYSSMTVVRAPSPSGGQRELAFEDIGVLAANMTFDPSQDLLAVIEQRGNSSPHPKITRDLDKELTIHLRSLMSNQTHPLAKKHVLHTFFHELRSGNITSNNVRNFYIFDDMLALLCGYSYGESYVRIWNWKSGEVVLERELVSPEVPDLSAAQSQAMLNLSVVSPVQ